MCKPWKHQSAGVDSLSARDRRLLEAHETSEDDQARGPARAKRKPFAIEARQIHGTRQGPWRRIARYETEVGMETRCGARPPSVGLYASGWWRWPGSEECGKIHYTALPLWWGGALVPEGWDRARRIYLMEGGSLLSHPASLVFDVFKPTICDTEVLAEGLVWRGCAARVVRLASVDGRLVEIS